MLLNELMDDAEAARLIGSVGGRDALMLAVKKDERTSLVKALLNKLKPINHQDQHGNTILHYAAMFNVRKETIDMLIKRGVKADILNKAGKKAFDYMMEDDTAKIHDDQQDDQAVLVGELVEESQD